MFEHRELSNQFKTYEVDAEDFDIFEGDIVAPGSEIGIDIRSGTAIFMEQWGRVATVYYNPMNQSFLIMIQLLTAINKPNNRVPVELEMQSA